MAHLACVAHERRVYVLDHVVQHREDGSDCNSPKLLLSKKELTPEEIRAIAVSRMSPGEILAHQSASIDPSKPVSFIRADEVGASTPSETLVREIFTDPTQKEEADA